MRTNTKNRLGIITAAGAGAAAIVVAGFALPASADEPREGDWSSFTTTLSAPVEAAQTWLTNAIEAGSASVSPETSVAPDTAVGDVSVIQGPIVGDVLSGNQTPVASGNDVQAPVASGNDVQAPVDVPVGSGNETGIEAPVVPETSIGGSVGDIGTQVGDLVDGLTSNLDLGGLLN